VATIDFQSGNPAYHAKSALNHERMHVNAVLLPDRTVLAVGGGVTREASAQTQQVDPQGGREVFEAEIYNLATNMWSITAAATVARLYHSVALLLPDGRVVSAGGNPNKGSQVNWLPPDLLEEMRLEIFSPPYLFKANTRPSRTFLRKSDTVPGSLSGRHKQSKSNGSTLSGPGLPRTHSMARSGWSMCHSHWFLQTRSTQMSPA